MKVKPKLSDFLLDLHGSLAQPRILDISTGMPAVFANPYASKSQHIFSQKIAQLRLKVMQRLARLDAPGRIELIPERNIKDLRGFLKGINTEFEREADRV